MFVEPAERASQVKKRSRARLEAGCNHKQDLVGEYGEHSRRQKFLARSVGTAGPATLVDRPAFGIASLRPFIFRFEVFVRGQRGRQRVRSSSAVRFEKSNSRSSSLESLGARKQRQIVFE